MHMEFYKIKLQMRKENTITYDDQKIHSALDIVDFLNNLEDYKYAPTEIVIVIALDAKNKIIAYSEISKGAIDNCILDIPSVFRVLLQTNSNRFILVHNHPSGDTTPSGTDIKITTQLIKACKIMGVQLVDHIIIGDDTYSSVLQAIKK